MRFDHTRKPLSAKAKQVVIEAGGGICTYCGEPATIAEHLIPYIYCQHNKQENLVPSCRICNQIAADKLFACFQEKREYILKKRQSPKWRRRLSHDHLVCRSCQEMFLPNIFGATQFLCPRCAYNEGYRVERYGGCDSLSEAL